MRDPHPHQEYITIVDNQGRERIQRVEYIVTGAQREIIYVTTDGLVYTNDSLARKGQEHLLEIIDQIPVVLSQPEIVIRDHLSPDDTLLYYRHIYVPSLVQRQFMCVVIKIRQGYYFFYNFFPQQSGKVKGYREIPPPAIWYVAPNQNPGKYGLPSGDD